MSKETFIGGDYIEFTGGNNLSYAKEEIINSSNRQIIQKGENGGVIYGTNGEVPFIEFNTGVALYVEFEPLGVYNGEFGFDWLRCDNSDNILKIQTDDISNLEYVFDESKIEYTSVGAVPSVKDKIKKDYNKVLLKVPYYAHWLNLMHIGQEIKLNMICKPIIDGEDITKEEISFRKNDFYEVIIDGKKNENIKYIPDGKPKEITIKCVKPSKEIDIVPADTLGKEVGRITAKDNTKIYDLPVRLVCVVKDTPNKETEISQLISDFKTEKIEDYLNNNSLNQALIKTTVEIDSKYRITFDETAWSGTFYNKAGNYFTNRKDFAGGKVTYIDDDGVEQKEAEYEHILDKFLRDYKTIFEADGKKFKGILLFITNINKDPADLEGGVSRTKPVNFREAIVFATNLKDKSTYAHELAHALGLEHYFWRDAEYKKNLDDLKQNNEDNKKNKKENEEAIKHNENNIKIEQNNIKIHQDNIKILNNRLKEYSEYYSKNPQEKGKINTQIKEQNDGIKKSNDKITETQSTNEKIKGYIKKNEKNESDYKDNLNVYIINKYKFKEKSTLNIMDYSSKVNIYTQWQWKIMQDDLKSYYGSLIENK